MAGSLFVSWLSEKIKIPNLNPSTLVFRICYMP